MSVTVKTWKHPKKLDKWTVAKSDKRKIESIYEILKHACQNYV